MVTDKEKESAPVSKRKEVIRKLFGKDEQFPVVEIPDTPEVPREIEQARPVPGSDKQLTKPVTDDQTGQTLVTSSTAQQTNIVLPLTEDEIREGLHHKVFDSIRWLAEWCLRKMKQVGIKLKKVKEN